MRYNCKRCGNTVIIPNKDAGKIKNMDGYCFNCRLVFANNLFKKLPSGDTLFSPMGTRLGDRIWQNLIIQYYRKNFKGKIHLAKDVSEFLDIRDKFARVFFANTFSGDKTFLPEAAYWFSVANEVNAFAKHNIYPVWNEFEYVNTPNNFVVLHLRQQNDTPGKNISAAIVYRILIELSKMTEFIILLGNDEVDDRLTKSSLSVFFSGKIIDLRNKLTLPQIAYILQKAKLFIGTDSGIAHLAAASGTKRILTFNYTNSDWFVKTPHSATCLMKQESTLANIIKKLQFSQINN